MRIGKVIKRYRRSSDIDIRKLAREIGIGTSTLSRIENGKEINSQTFGKILLWLFKAETRNQPLPRETRGE